jgi:NAD(P)-dependent dehydrogenase (short-subunit alcohol dehydrogenase family)
MPSILSLEGKVALVTGASRGIGRAIALELAAQGASVMINFLNSKETAEEIANTIIDSGRQAAIMF